MEKVQNKKDQNFQQVSIVMPVYNERNTIEIIVERVQRVDIPKELIIIDDGSTDGTREWLHQQFGQSPTDGETGDKGSCQSIEGDPPIRVFFHKKNLGKGAALKTGFQHARGEIVIVQDADLEYNPEEYSQLLEPLITDQADVVYGARFGRTWVRQGSLFSYLGNKIFTQLINAATGLSLTDVWTGYKVFKKEVLEGISLKESRFEMEVELTLKIAHQKWRVTEIPISYQPRSKAEGKKIGWKDGIQALKMFYRYRPTSRVRSFHS